MAMFICSAGLLLCFMMLESLPHTKKQTPFITYKNTLLAPQISTIDIQVSPTLIYKTNQLIHSLNNQTFIFYQPLDLR